MKLRVKRGQKKKEIKKYMGKVYTHVPVRVPFGHWQNEHPEKYMYYSHSRVRDHALPRLKSSREEHIRINDVHCHVHLGF